MPSWLSRVSTSCAARTSRATSRSPSAARSARKPSLSSAVSGKFIARMKSATEIGGRSVLGRRAEGQRRLLVIAAGGCGTASAALRSAEGTVWLCVAARRESGERGFGLALGGGDLVELRSTAGRTPRTGPGSAGHRPARIASTAPAAARPPRACRACCARSAPRPRSSRSAGRRRAASSTAVGALPPVTERAGDQEERSPTRQHPDQRSARPRWPRSRKTAPARPGGSKTPRSMRTVLSVLRHGAPHRPWCLRCSGSQHLVAASRRPASGPRRCRLRPCRSARAPAAT